MGARRVVLELLPEGGFSRRVEMEGMSRVMEAKVVRCRFVGRMSEREGGVGMVRGC